MKKITMTITKHHQKEYDYYYYEVQFEGAKYKLNGMQEDLFARLADDLEAMKAEEDETDENDII